MTEYLDSDDVDGLVHAKGFHYRDRNGLLSALAAPLPVFGEEVHVGLHRKAAVLLAAINSDHPLLDGSKRLSWYVTAVFYDFNGYDLTVDADEGDLFIRRVAGASPPPLDDIAVWLQNHARPSS